MSNETDTAATIIAMERAALDRWGKGDPSGYLEISAPEVVYFDPFLERRLDGLEALTRYYDALRGQVRIDRDEMINPKVACFRQACVEGEPGPTQRSIEGGSLDQPLRG